MQRYWAHAIGRPLAKKLQEGGYTLSALTLKKSTHRYFLRQQEVAYREIVNIDAVSDDPEKYLDGEAISLEEICNELGVDTIWPLVQAVRTLVKSYEDKFGRGFKQNVSDEMIILFVKAWFKMVRDMFRNSNPDIIVAPNYVSLVHIMFSLYGKKRNVPMLGGTDTKVDGYNMFTYSYLDDEGPVIDRFHEMQAGAVSPHEDKAKQYIQRFKEEFGSDVVVPPQKKKFLKDSS